ncbi:chromosome segregation protein SMC [Longibacter salinarum]|uniref:Chromosome partition protein Smc n=1 Tax=Longibacter salinarum TaxID=1850348 RepID=A0A2A8CTP9_9BACT|nr:chromosome segregation protein SMC [Longibacter salinarum]PEN11069.1 chromosome segregation protein SMC [Longibacter salinarum]
MYLSKLELHGFKSFAEPTTLAYDPGVTAIVGPNGCGKSNIVDAVRWVIGEQRPTVLRSEKMENVIFNGTADRRPLGMAEVQLTIENNRGVLPTEYSEVTIGRRLFRDGKSEYLMNGTQCRLKDITSLFMDTGMGADAYSVIELKMIDEILSGSTEDRRRMFEEAAGITRYKMRRRQALRKLDNTQTDLDRLRDLTDEIGSQVRRLKKQAKKASKYNEFTERLHELELILAQVEVSRLTKKRRSLQEEQEKQEKRNLSLADQEETAEGRLAELRTTLQQREDALQDKREALQEHRSRVRDMESEQRLQRERLDRARRDRDRAQQAQTEATERRADLVDEVDRLEDSLERARPALEEAEEALKAAREARDSSKHRAEELRERVRSLRGKSQTAEKTLSERRRELDRLTNRLDLLEEERDRARDQAGELQADVDVLDTRVERAEAARAEAEKRRDEAERAVIAIQDEKDAARDDVEAATEKLRDIERRRDAAAAEVELLEGLVSSYDEFSDAVQFLATDGPLDDLQTVADVLACDDDVRVALDAALGDLASCVVVGSDAEARTAIQQLREQEKGQATFIVLDRLPSPVPNGEGPAGTRALRSTVRTADSRYDRLADVLLQGCYLAGTLDDATAAAREATGTSRIFAHTGEWVDARGVMKGGSKQDNTSPVASRLGRREQLERAQEQLEQLEADVEYQQTVVDEAKDSLDSIRVEPSEDALTEAENELSEADSRLDRVRYERESIDERRDELDERLEELTDELEEGKERVEALRGDVDEALEEVDRLRARRGEAEDALDEAEDAERQAVDAFSEANVAAVEARNRVQNLERDLERTQEQIEEIDRQTKRRTEEIAQLRDTIESAMDAQSELDEKIETARLQRDDKEDAVEEAEEALKATKAQINDIEKKLREIRQEREAAVKAENKAAVRLAEIGTRMQDLLESVDEDYERDLATNPVDVPDELDAKEAENEVQSLRRKIKRLGNVNPLALEEYEEEKERLDFLTEQREDLEEAEETLLETIEEINSTAAERFFDTYGQIKESFSKIFTELFGAGASAELKLEEPDNPLDTAIDVIAQPKGKRPVTLEQLSSGEKTLTAIALLFSIYLVKPSPFCILDEVDAPLDDANVERFMSLIRRFEGDTQFILVTHNQRTMALADRMYGVTMEDQGVSKLVGVEFDEAVEMAG